MTVSNARKQANAKWDRENMTTIGCRVKKDKAARFKAACIDAGTTINAVFLAAMDEFMYTHASTTAPQSYDED